MNQQGFEKHFKSAFHYVLPVSQRVKGILQMLRFKRRRQLNERVRRARTAGSLLKFDRLEDRRLLATFVVTSNADAGAGTLRNAIIQANATTTADVISFDGSVFTGGSNSLIRLTSGELEITNSLTINGSGGRHVTITGDASDDDVTNGADITDVEASFTGSAGESGDLLDDNSRVLNFSSITGDLILEGLTLTGGRTTIENDRGGGVRFDSEGQLTLVNSKLSGNSTSGYFSHGGGVGAGVGDVNVVGSDVSRNRTSGIGAQGGGISTSLGSVSLTNSTVVENSTLANYAMGGGIQTISGDVNLTDSSVSQNSTSGDYGSGGGISIEALGGVTLTNSEVSDNSTDGDDAPGGGVDVQGSVTLVGSTISGNRTSGDRSSGGGIAGDGGTVSLLTSTVSENSTSGRTSHGGGIYTRSGAIDLGRSEVTGNQVTGEFSYGGGIYTLIGSLNGSGSTIDGNSTQWRGGGIYAKLGSVALENSTISRNSGGTRGGGIAVYSAAVTLNSSTVSGNTMSKENALGGGISTGGVLNVLNSTVTGNSATTGGGVFEFNSTTPSSNVTIRNSIVAGNSDAGTAPDLRIAPENTSFTTYSLIGVAEGAGVILGVNQNETGTLAEPLDPLLGPLADNGGLTQTHALLPGSPAINAGDPAQSGSDQRGNPFVRDDGNGVDIGAYERQSLALPELVVTTTLDELDYSNNITSLREAINIANGSIGADQIRFDESVFTGGANSLIRLTRGELQVTDSLAVDGSNGLSVTITGDADGNDVTDPFNVTTIASSFGGILGDLLGDNSRVLHFLGATGDLSLEGLTLTGGRTLETLDFGGGIRFESGGRLTLTKTDVSGNSTTGDGAAGGGIFIRRGEASLIQSVVSGNSTSGIAAFGGGLSADFSASLSLIDSTVSGNRTTGSNAYGGGISTLFGDIELSSSTVSGNSAEGPVGNAGGVFTLAGEVTVASSTITANVAAGAVGGIAVYDSQINPNFTVLNSIVAGNTDDGTAPDLMPDPESVITIDHSLLGASGLTISGGDNRLGTISAPIDPLLGPLRNNGGKTQTHALLPGSPAIDAGDPGQSGFDQRGAPFVRSHGDGVDIGAYERQTVASSFFIVTTTEDDLDFADADVSLREAIYSANGSVGANAITFDLPASTNGPDSLIRLMRGELEITDSLIIDGSTAGGLTITGDANGNDVTDALNITDVSASFNAAAENLLDDNSRVLNFSGETGNLTLTNLTVTGGHTTGFVHDGGGIIFSSSGQLSLNNTVVSGNSTTGDEGDGGGIYSFDGNLSLINSMVSSNQTTGGNADGGGIFTKSGDVNLSNSSVSGNRTTGGGADGGGIYTSTGNVQLDNSTVSGNSTLGSRGDGGGIYNRRGFVDLTSSTISGNSIAGDLAKGGGVFSIEAVTLISSTVTDNSTAFVGGGIYLFSSSRNPDLIIENSIVAGNSDRGTAPDLRIDPDSEVTINFSLIGVDSGRDFTGGNNQIGTLALPIDPLIGPLADNGGPTRTHALLPISPAIDAGSSTNLFDQRGAPFSRNVGGAADIGAFEFNDAVGVPPNVLSTTINEGGVLVRPDLWETLTVQFDRDVSITPGALSLNSETLAIAGLLVSTTLDYDASTFTATWTFDPANPLSPGFYTFVLDSYSITANGANLNGNGGGFSGDDWAAQHYVAIPGDANLDGRVNVLGDAFALVGNLGTTSGAGWADGDFNGDGKVDVLNDAFTLVGRLGQSSTIAPAVVLSAVVNEGGVLSRPDLWQTLTVRFDRDVWVTPGALSLNNDTMGITDLSIQTTFDYNPANFTATWTFDPANPLPAAFYSYALDAAAVTTGGFQLDGNGDGSDGDDFVAEHHVAVPGDANLDGTVDVLGDAFALVSSLGTTTGAVWANGDFNSDGKVDVLADAFALVSNLGRSVASPTSQQSAVSESASTIVGSRTSVQATPIRPMALSFSAIASQNAALAANHKNSQQQDEEIRERATLQSTYQTDANKVSDAWPSAVLASETETENQSSPADLDKFWETDFEVGEILLVG